MIIKNTLAGFANKVFDCLLGSNVEPCVDAFVKQLVGVNDASHRLSDNAYNEFKVNLQKSGVTQKLKDGGMSWAEFADMMSGAMNGVSEQAHYPNDKRRAKVLRDFLGPILRADADIAVPVYIGSHGNKQMVTLESLIGYILHVESPKELGERLGFLPGSPLPSPIFAGNRVN